MVESWASSLGIFPATTNVDLSRHLLETFAPMIVYLQQSDSAIDFRIGEEGKNSKIVVTWTAVPTT